MKVSSRIPFLWPTILYYKNSNCENILFKHHKKLGKSFICLFFEWIHSIKKFLALKNTIEQNKFHSQAPPSMKSVLQACWLVTTAFGDLIVVILSLSKPVDGVVSYLLYNAFCRTRNNFKLETRNSLKFNLLHERLIFTEREIGLNW